MQVTQTTADGLKREFAVVVAAAEIETKIAARLEQLATTTQLPGFRPGKVPVGLMRQKYGDAVTGEVLEDSVNLGTQQALAENELKPALQPQIEITKFEPGSDLEYTIAVESDIDPNSLASTKQTIHMFIEKSPLPIIKSHTFPHTIPQHEP